MEYSWESYHSTFNDAGSSTALSKELAAKLSLINKPQTFDLFDSNNSKATISMSYYDSFNNNHSFVFLRKDLLERYLKEINQNLFGLSGAKGSFHSKLTKDGKIFLLHTRIKENSCSKG
ncbi:hypothetical protein [Flavobacterium sp. CSZ]|uniref:hypothetical protein n=1 Tax=Flavobacterium sp. CSZ TaxID=2783791 RepID=UPI00188D42AC|nr:hypothetical protein [Flavobacterium sp. CSZ]MBF4487738.1 hypothetical protein [Flavobacterium sp. CSZ]